MSYVIYKIENLKNNRKYIGQTVRFKKRKWKHFQRLRNNKHENQHLQHSFNKYGEDNFEMSVLCKVKNKEEADIKEDFYINKYGLKNCYNMKMGGDGSVGYKHSKESLKKITKNRKYKKGKKHERYIQLDEQKIIDLYLNKKHSTYEIANRFNCSQSKISKTLKENHIKIRDNRDNQKRGKFGFRGGRFLNNSKNPWNRRWQSTISYNNRKQSLGFFEDPLSAQIVYNLVKKELERL